jgi:hypothetical protein
LLPPGVPQAQVAIWSMAFLATPGLILPVQFATSSLHINNNPEELARGLNTFRLFFITLTMTAIGFVALFIWDGVFPDRRDARLLTPLPVPGGVLIGARLLALAVLCAFFIVGINIVPTAFYAPTISHFGGAANQVQGLLAFIICNALAGIFVFASLVLLQGLALNLGGRTAADRLSLVMQVVFVAALLQMVFYMPRVGSLLPVDLASGSLRALPSVWFLGLYDVIGGRSVTGSPMLATIAVAATLGTTAAAVALFVSTHARLTRRALEARDVTSPKRTVASLPASAERLLASPGARAVFGYTVRSLARSRSHRLLMAMYVGIAFALVASAIVPVAIHEGLAGFARPRLELLSAPLVLSFFALVGMRMALAIPIEPKASWVFRIREPADRIAAMSGVRAAMLFVAVMPPAVIAFVTAASLWGLRHAVVHSAICAAMGTLLTEILMVRLRKLPFACTYYPGNSRLGTLWPLYLTGFATYSYTVAAWQVEFMMRPRPVVIFLGVIGLAVMGLAWLRRRYLNEISSLIFAEIDSTALFAGFDLSEGLAARAGSGREP